MAVVAGRRGACAGGSAPAAEEAATSLAEARGGVDHPSSQPAPSPGGAPSPGTGSAAAAAGSLYLAPSSPALLQARGGPAVPLPSPLCPFPATLDVPPACLSVSSLS